jgi:hypothetical protein
LNYQYLNRRGGGEGGNMIKKKNLSRVSSKKLVKKNISSFSKEEITGSDLNLK